MMTMFLLMLAGSAAAQEQELTKAERKALQERIDSLQYAEAVQALNDRAFTLEADQVLFKYGQMAYVNSNTNFVSVKDNHAVVQVAFNIPISGPNGLGGVTVEGTFTGYDLKKDKKGNLSLSMNVLGTGISARVDITTNPKPVINYSFDLGPQPLRHRGLRAYLLPERNAQVCSFSFSLCIFCLDFLSKPTLSVNLHADSQPNINGNNTCPTIRLTLIKKITYTNF